jgi:hypothetical protein
MERPDPVDQLACGWLFLNIGHAAERVKGVDRGLDDQTNTPEEAFGDWAAGRLTKELEQRSQRVLAVDYEMIRDFLEKRGISVKELEKPKVLDLLSQVFGLNAVVTGIISGPYVFTAPPAKGQEGTAYLSHHPEYPMMIHPHD